MSRFQRFKSLAIGVSMILFALIMLTLPKEDYDVISTIIALMMIIYGLRLLFFYRSMARHMVGGKIILYEAIIILDLGLFTISLASSVAVSNSYIILFYLLSIYAFSGVINVLRSFEAKNNGSTTWKHKFVGGVVLVLYSITLVILTVVFREIAILKLGFCLSLLYSAGVRIVHAFRKTAIVYIQ